MHRSQAVGSQSLEEDLERLLAPARGAAVFLTPYAPHREPLPSRVRWSPTVQARDRAWPGQPIPLGAILRCVMSENLDLVRSIYADWERGDWSSTWWAHPEIEMVYVGGPEPGTSRGLGAMAETYAAWLTAWEDFSVLPEEYRELDDGRVFVLVTNAGKGKESGVDIGNMIGKGANVFDIDAGKVRTLAVYFDRDRALADLGLNPEGEVS